MARWPCLSTPPRRPPWTVEGPGPLLRTVERAPRILEAGCGLRSSPQAGPMSKDGPLSTQQAAPTEAELAALLAARRAYNRHYTAIQTMLQTNDDSEHDLSYVKIVNFETALAPRLVETALRPGLTPPPHRPARCLLGLGPLLRAPKRRLRSLEACVGPGGRPPAAPRTRMLHLQPPGAPDARLPAAAAAADPHGAPAGARTPDLPNGLALPTGPRNYTHHAGGQVANPRPRTVYLSRHGFSEYNVLHKLGGNPRLSQWGEECAEAGSGTLACSAPVLSSRGAPTGTRRGSAHGRASTCCATRAGRERRRSYGRPRCSGRS